MLAKFKPGLILFGIITTACVGSLTAQTQTPSKNSNPVPPSVHIPANPRAEQGATNQFNFSDSGVKQTGRPAFEDNQVKPTTFLQDEEPKVPSLLAGPGRLMPSSPTIEITKKKLESESNQPGTAKADPTANKLPVVDKPKMTPAVMPQEPVKKATETPSTSGIRVANANEFGRRSNEDRIPPADTTTENGAGTVDGSGSFSRQGAQVSKTHFESKDTKDTMVLNAPKSGTNSILSMAMPTIEIDAVGPQTIGVHKRAQYKVTVRNTSGKDAEQLVVNVGLPQWIKLENVSTTIGRREASAEQRISKVTWTIDRLSAGTSQVMTLDAMPTKAEHFDLQVDWFMQPKRGSTRVEVTEPRLDMNIAGPNEVMYGETANYQVTVRNPGTGTAENVTVTLPEALGGERASLGEIAPGQERTFQVELLARAAGQLDLTTTATGAGDLQTQSSRSIIVRRPVLDISIVGPPIKYSGSVAQYDVTITNTGDAVARDVSAALALPSAVQYLEGIEGSELIDNAMRWNIGTLDVGDKRTYRVSCQLNGEGQIQLDLGARGSSDTAAVSHCNTDVETVADMVLTVEDPKGPLPTGQKIDYVIRVKNRGSRVATNLELVMQYSDGIEPTTALGMGHQVVPGQVVFETIDRIEPGQEIKLQVTAQAINAGTHRFRAQLTGTESDVREVAEGTTRFYGDSITPSGSGSQSTAQKPDTNDFGR